LPEGYCKHTLSLDKQGEREGGREGGRERKILQSEGTSSNYMYLHTP